jgi:predicted adenylyl cyclase CyaB
LKNIEIKSPLSDRPGTEERLRSLGAKLEWTRRQIDTFFNSPSGWLKLREVEGCPAELISYRRSVENSGPRESDYNILRIDEACELSSILESSLGILGRVEKRRSLWIYRNTRVHLDRVEGLGDFLELETVLADIDGAKGAAESEEVINLLELDRESFISVPYLELLRVT